ncbi:MAG: DinB family protein [Chloroflexi bacterium]|nr:DinB family protein [Chloroflexota bacterium]MBI3762651.1 DinB family protein [Chloroflexota bacterium]
MTHPLVAQLRFTRSEWLRALDGISNADARRRFEPMNCISWMIGHLTWHEHLYWLVRAQSKNIAPQLDELVGYGKPASTPPLDDMWTAWRTVTVAADPYLDALTTEMLQGHMIVDGQPHYQTIGTMIQRIIYHYWYHIGESQAARQLLGHASLPEFVGDIQGQGPYRPESSV